MGGSESEPMSGLVSESYTGRRARRYNRVWRRYERGTLAAALQLLDDKPLQISLADSGRVRILDAGCGTGLLLYQLAQRFPSARLYGVDPSVDMLKQARALLRDISSISLEVATIDGEPCAGLPFAPGTFDVIMCTSVLHYMRTPVLSLSGLADLLAPTGQLVLVDYARRGAPFPWTAFESLIRVLDRQHVRAYTLEEGRSLCLEAGLQVHATQTIRVDWLWGAWALRATQADGVRTV